MTATKRLLAILVLALFSTFAFSQTNDGITGNDAIDNANSGAGATSGSCNKNEPNAEVASLQLIYKGVENKFGDDMLQAFADAGKSIAGNLIDPARALGGSLLLAYILFGISKNLASQKATLGFVVDALVVGGIVAGILGSYDIVVSSAVGLAKGLNGIVGGDNPLNILSTFFMQFLQGLGNAWEKGSAEWKCASGLQVFSFIGEIILAVLILIVAILYICSAIVEIFTALAVGPILLGLGIAIGPIFIATFVTPITKGFFDRWLGFIAGAAIFQFIAYTIVVLVGQFLGTVTQSEMSFLAQAISIALVAAVLGKVFQQVPSIVSSLVPGSLGVSSVSGSSVASGAMAGAVAGATVGAVGGAFAGAFRAADAGAGPVGVAAGALKNAAVQAGVKGVAGASMGSTAAKMAGEMFKGAKGSASSKGDKGTDGSKDDSTGDAK